jgi:hypothetical protein
MTSAAYRDSTLEVSGSYREMTEDFRDQEASVRYDQHYLQIARQFEVTKDLTYLKKQSASFGGQYLSETFSTLMMLITIRSKGMSYALHPRSFIDFLDIQG